MSSSPVTLEYKDRIAIITINNEKKANALTQDQYYILATHMREVATRDDVFITLLTAKGAFSQSFFPKHKLTAIPRSILLGVSQLQPPHQTSIDTRYVEAQT
jgi:peroxisomal 3,2-trans-enoyl-CoA isomerase